MAKREIDYSALSYRTLNGHDFWSILKIIRAGGKKAFAQLGQAETNDERAMVIIDVGMEHAEEELTDFLASIAGTGEGKDFKRLTRDEYMTGPFDLSLTIIENVQENNDLASFFERSVNFIKKFTPKK